MTTELTGGSLPDRMEAAADVLNEATRRYHRLENVGSDGPDHRPWSAVDLRMRAAVWRCEDQGREQLRNELADVMREAGAGNPAFSLRIVADLLLQIYDIKPKVQPSIVTAGGAES